VAGRHRGRREVTGSLLLAVSGLTAEGDVVAAARAGRGRRAQPSAQQHGGQQRPAAMADPSSHGNPPGAWSRTRDQTGGRSYSHGRRNLSSEASHFRLTARTG
jgi:hypothetical protein